MPARNVSELANQVASATNKKLVMYISAETHPPLMSGYLKTKYKAEEFISKLENIDFYSLRCGLITSDKRNALRPLGKFFETLKSIQNSLPGSELVNDAKPGDFMKNFDIPNYIELDDLANTALYLHLNPHSYDKNILKKEDMLTLSEKFQNTY